MGVILRSEAAAQGAIRYFTGKPCRRRQHIAERLTSNGKCTACAREDSLAFARADPERNRTRVKAWQKANPERHAAKTTAHFRKKRYNLSTEELNAMLAKQRNACAICLKPFEQTPHVDHCHNREVVRGLLCGPCNLGLGLFKDNPTSLLAAIDYLDRTVEQRTRSSASSARSSPCGRRAV